jgi:hypothetical protein
VFWVSKFIPDPSPNAEEAFALLSMTASDDLRASVEAAAKRFIEYGVGDAGQGAVIVRCGALGSYTLTITKGGRWVDAFWNGNDEKVVDVTGECFIHVCFTQQDWFQVQGIAFWEV